MLDGVVANMVVAVELIQKAIDPISPRNSAASSTSPPARSKCARRSRSFVRRARRLTAFLAGVARSVAASNVTINFVLPGTFETDRFTSNIQATAKKKNISYDAAFAERVGTVPAKRVGQPDELGATCAFLCSAQSGYITGQNILIDGGAFPGAF